MCKRTIIKPIKLRKIYMNVLERKKEGAKTGHLVAWMAGVWDEK